MKDVKVLIVGAGPAGFSVAAECSYHEVPDVLVLEKGPTHNQTVYQYYPDDKRVDAAYAGQQAICAGVLCFRDTTKTNFLSIVDEMVKSFSLPIRYEANVDSIKKRPDGYFNVSAGAGDDYRAQFVVISTGRMGKPNRPDYFNAIPAAARTKIKFDTRNLDAAGKEILVVGGGNSAIEFALSLAPKAKVTVSYRQTSFSRLNPMNLALLEADEKAGKITILRGSNVASVGEAGGRPLVKFEDGSEKAFEYVIYGIGGSSPAAFLQNAGIELDAKGNPKLTDELETNVSGLFVAGELSVPPGKGSIINSFNSGKRVVETICRRLNIPRKPELVSLN